MTHTRRVFTAAMLGVAVPAAAGTDPIWLSIGDAGELLRQRRLSAVELAQACLRRIESRNPALNAFVTVTAEAALAQARTLDAELRAGRPRGPLHGIPVALKDVIDTAGIRTTAGSAQYAARVPSEDAEVVRRLRAAGAVLLGKLNMDEFAYSFTSETSVHGPSHNPWDERRSPGGSSGGAGIAVATGMCFAALGTDTGGSVRLPAALCGITGLKPSYGRVSTRGVLPLAWTLDHVGPMCRSSRDAALVLATIGEARVAGTPRNVKTLRVGVPRKLFYEQLDPEVAHAVEEATTKLERLTVGVEDIPWTGLEPSPRWPELPLIYSRVISAEAYTFHEEMLRRSPERYHSATREILVGGAAVSAPQYIRARLEVERLRAEADRLFGGVDVLLTPTAPAGAFELGVPASLAYLRNSAPWNVYGLPSISVPCGFTSKGLPIGLQMTGRFGSDETVLALADAFQQSTAWHSKRPPS